VEASRGDGCHEISIASLAAKAFDSAIPVAAKGCGYTTGANFLAVRYWIHFGLTLLGSALFFGAFAVSEFQHYALNFGSAAANAGSAAAIYFALVLLLSLYLAPGFSGPREWCARSLRGRGRVWIAIAAFQLAYLIYCAGTGDFRLPAFLRLAALAAVPLGTFAIAPVRDTTRLNWQDVFILVWLFVPVMFGGIGGIWNIPVNLDFATRVYLVAVGAWSFIVVRGVKNSGYEFRFSWALLKDALVSLAWFTAIGLPVGFAMRFIGWNPRWRGFTGFATDYVTIFLFVAVAEELFFRGLLQNLLEGTVQSRHIAQAISSILFGLSHIRHAPAPNWRYVILATIAGWFYGWAYRKHRSLMASATTHALVDTIWRTWLTLPRL
jgi:membrane protease YdiL (CAAX protease family)